jgi:hypothetical protein
LSDLEKLESGFLATLAVLKDVLPEIIVVGGWCPYLYARYLWKKPIPEIPTTTDIDLGVLETGSRRFGITVYAKLKAAGYALERIYEGEELPVEFIYQKKTVKLKIEFITSFETSDDTLNRFLGSELACNRIEAFELLLKRTVTLPIRIKNEFLAVKMPPPEIFFYHKSITFVMRSEEFKRDKDLFYAYFILKFHPDKAALLATLAGLKKDEYFSAFRENIREYLSEYSSPGYLILRPFLRGWIEEGSINGEIQNAFKEIFELF